VGEALFKNFSDINHLKQQAILSRFKPKAPFSNLSKTQEKPKPDPKTKKKPKKQALKNNRGNNRKSY
jgi:hypothetical protein